MTAMSESDPLLNLEELSAESPFEAAFRLMKEYEDVVNTCLQSEDLPSQEINELIDDLDASWQFINAPMTISGNVLREIQADDEPPIIGWQWVQDLRVISNGFQAQRFEKNDDPNQFVVKFGLSFKMADTKLKQGILHQDYSVGYCFASPESILITNFEKSLPMLSSELHYLIPDQAEEIDTRMLNAQNACGAVVALQNFGFQVERQHSDEILLELEQYMNKLLTFDTKAPYIIDFSGECYEITQLGGIDGEIHETAYANPGNAIASLKSLRLVKRLICDTEMSEMPLEYVSVCLQLEILDLDDPEKDTGKEYLVPITSTMSLQDTRSLLVEGIRKAKKAEASNET